MYFSNSAILRNINLIINYHPKDGDNDLSHHWVALFHLATNINTVLSSFSQTRLGFTKFTCWTLLPVWPISLQLHSVPKLTTPLASNTLNSVWSSWISTKYCTLHYHNITYCHTYYDAHTLPCVLSVMSLWRQSLFGMNLTTWPAYYWQGDQAVGHPPKSLRRGQRWPLWAQTLKTSSEWSSLWMFHIL